MPHLQCAALWRTVDKPGTEYCGLWRYATGWELAGTILTAFDERVAQIRYYVYCDTAWHTRSVILKLSMGNIKQQLQITVDEAQRWWLDGSELDHLVGCIDVDLSISPATNTLPIRRLRLEESQNAELDVAHIRFPDMSLTPHTQQYTRLPNNQYLFENIDNDFTTEIESDEFGLVVSYPEGWERDVFVNCLKPSD